MLSCRSQPNLCQRGRNPTPAHQPDQPKQEYIVVDSKEYESVEQFCYLGDMLSTDGGAEAALTAWIRKGLIKFRDFAPFVASGISLPKLKSTVYAICK